MLTIEYCNVEDQVKIGDLFDQLGFTDDHGPTDSSGDSCIKNEWSIEALTTGDEYYQIEAFRWTKPERQVVLTLSDYPAFRTLQCSPEHIVAIVDSSGESRWVLVKHLRRGDTLVTQHGNATVFGVEEIESIERLCDLQVSYRHSYYTNDILSHNSHLLTQFGAYAMQVGIDVLHYTFELSETQIGIRYDSNLVDIDSSDVPENKDKIISFYGDNKQYGRLIVKYFPTGSCSVYTIRSHLDMLATRGFIPGLVIVDYADIMRSSRKFDSLRHELKLIYEELRGLAAEKGFALWTASQSNKEGANSDIVDLTNMSEAYGKAAIADFVLGLSRKSTEKANGAGRLFVAKNRAGKDGLVYPIHINTARSKFIILGASGTFEEASNENESDIKRAIRQKWKELKNDATLGDKMKDPTPATDSI